jgi:hypothetical protein
LGGLFEWIGAADGELQVALGDPGEDLLEGRDEEVGAAHYLGEVEADDGVATLHEGCGDDGPTLPARGAEDDHPAEDVEALEVLLGEVAAHHLQDDVGPLAPSV